MASTDGQILDYDPAENASGLKFMLRALRHRNYRLFFFGQGVSLVGTWLTTTATSWLVLTLAHSSGLLAAATVLGAVRFAGMIPMSLFAPAAGVLVDRLNRHQVLIATQILSMLQSTALAVLTFSGKINVPCLGLQQSLLGELHVAGAG